MTLINITDNKLLFLWDFLLLCDARTWVTQMRDKFAINKLLLESRHLSILSGKKKNFPFKERL